MLEPDFGTTFLHEAIDRFQRGDLASCDELIRRVRGRLQAMAERMLRRFPSVGRWEQSDDVLQNALMRLVRALETERPATTLAFFGLASVQLRRELIDLARHYTGPLGHGANHASVEGGLAEPPAAEDLADLERWCAFHEAVELLPALEREAFSLSFYHNWTQDQIAGALDVSVMTVRRRYKDACEVLGKLLRDDFPAA